ncbi:MAG: hypothetical protein Q7S97_12620, partial [Polaromonas sp.]|nr:hypothetical protein [Polaromonas sp.]
MNTLGPAQQQQRCARDAAVDRQPRFVQKSGIAPPCNIFEPGFGAIAVRKLLASQCKGLRVEVGDTCPGDHDRTPVMV